MLLKITPVSNRGYTDCKVQHRANTMTVLKIVRVNSKYSFKKRCAYLSYK